MTNLIKKPKVYWAHPITMYSRTHKQKIDDHKSGKNTLDREMLALHHALYIECIERENEVHQHLKTMGYDVIDPGCKEIDEKFKAWQEEPLTKYFKDDNGELPADILAELHQKALNERSERLAKPMPFFTNLSKNCDVIAFTDFKDELYSVDAPLQKMRIGSGVWKEIDSVVNRSNVGEVVYLRCYEDDIGPVVFQSAPYPWPKNRQQNDYVTEQEGPFCCLSYPATKALLVLEGYTSQSSKHKNKQK
jgi:hypothetical protein